MSFNWNSNGNGHSNDIYIPKRDLLEVEEVETYALKNAETHRTEKYELVRNSQPVPVLRRSAKFFLGLRSGNRVADFSKDDIRVVFLFGPRPNVTQETKIVLTVDPSRTENSLRKPEHWDCLLYRINGKTAILEVQIGCEAPVGEWRCQITSFGQVVHELKSMYILFNPFSSDDSVFLGNKPKSHVEEYVLNDVGKVYTGSYKRPIGRDWAFGQFEETVLPAAVYILDKARTLRPSQRGDPIKVSRTISAMVNDVDDKGVLSGRWQPPYEPHTAPWEWSGSVAILEKYMEGQGRQPVKYGQCWVFSAVTTTICRALGLPCRSVTNYVSAHDTNQSLTIDRFFSASGEELTSRDDPEFGQDSIWNFHVWNDVWMARKDLPEGFGGWQAIDATPQEASENFYQCGPASLEAIRRGQVGLGYDVAFVFSEVNADVCHFVEDPKSSWGFTKTKNNTYHVGKMVLTKSLPGPGGDAEDITHLYKPEEGSKAERLSVYNAIRNVDRALKYYDLGKRVVEDVHMTLEDIQSVKYGDPYKIRLNIDNRSGKNRTLTALVKSTSIYNDGTTGHLIRKSSGEFTWPAGKSDALALTVYPADYNDLLVDYCIVKITAVVRVHETNQFWSEEDDFTLTKPTLKVEAVGTLQAGRMGRIRLSFINPLEVSLTRCRISLESPGAFHPIIEQVSDVRGRRSFEHEVLVNPRRAGVSTVVATFTSREMIDVHGSVKLDIR